jgi:hypothetical protein
VKTVKNKNKNNLLKKSIISVKLKCLTCTVDSFVNNILLRNGGLALNNT